MVVDRVFQQTGSLFRLKIVDGLMTDD